MVTVQSHIKQWTHNRHFLESIDVAYPDWLVTVTFYAALHAVDALLLHDKVRSITSHDSRNKILSQTNRYKKINSCYYPLYDLSRTIRYIANEDQWVPFEKIDSDIFGRYLYPIESSVSKLAGLELGLKPIRLRS